MHNFAQVLSEEEFVQFYYLLMERPDIEEIFRVYADSATNRMTPERLARFFAEEQKMVLGAEECAAIIRNHEPTEDKSAFTQLGFVQFLMFSELQVWKSKDLFLIRHKYLYYSQWLKLPIRKKTLS